MGHLHLPPDYFVIAANTLSDADNLARASPDSHAPAFAAQTIRNLDDFIALVENAFQNCETEEMDLTTFHSVLCCHVTALYTRYQIVLDPVDLDRAMYLSEMLRHYCDPTNIQLLAVGISFIASGLCLQTMFQKANDVHESVTVPRSPPSNPSHTIVIDLSSTGPDPQFPPKCDDAQSLARIVEQLDTVIANAEKTISSNNSGDNQELGDLYKALTAQGMALYNRYQVLGSANDLDHSISVLEIASQLRPPSLSLPDVEAWMVFRVRGQSYILRFNRDGNSEDFDAAIEIEEQIVSRRWNISVQESLVDSQRLFSHLADRLEVRGGTGDISRALEVLEDIRPHLSRKVRSISSQMISESILKLSILGRKILDLHRIVYILQQMRGDDPGDPTPYICGRFLRLQLKIAVITGDQEHAHNAEVEIYAETEGRHAPFEPLFDQDSISDLDLAIDLLRRRFNSQRSLDESTPHEAYTMLLISALYDRFKRFERSSDLREALAVRSSLGPLGLYCVDFVLLNASMEDFDPFGVQEKSKRAVAIHKSRYPKCPCHRIVKTHPLNTRVPNPPSRYGNKVEPDDHIRRVIVGDQRSMNSDTHPNQEELPPSHISPEDGSDQRSDHMWSLYLSHFQQWLTGTRIEDLEQAVSYAKQVVDGLPDDDQSVRAWKRRSDWASVLFMLHDQTQEIPNSQLRLAHDYFREIVSDPHHLLHYQRLAGVDTWFERLPYLIEENREHVLDMCNLALSLLQEHTWAASNIRSSMDSRYRLRGLIPNAVFLTMLSDPSHIPRAIEILDAGQSLVWSQLSSLRVQLGELSSRDSDLAKRFHQLSSAYEVQAGISVQSAEDASVPHNWDLSRDREKVLEEIRALPGFEGFLKPKTFQQLADFAKNGPLIVLTSHLGGCIATILHRNGYSSRALPMSGDTITNLNQALRKLTKTRGSDDSFLGESNEVTMTSPEPGTSHSVEMDTRSLKRKHPTELMYDVLKVLWKEIAEPVIAQIMDLREGPKGKSKMRDIPVCTHCS